MKLDSTFIKSVKGFLDLKEGEKIYSIAKKASKLGPCLEIGSYCGKSTIYIGNACKEEETVMFSIDHHKGSEEHQFGEEYFDSNLFDYKTSSVNTFNMFRKNILKANLEDTVIPIINKSSIIAKIWNIPLGMVFIDGSHSYDNVKKDYDLWHKHIMSKGYLIFHDIYKDQETGGQGPYEIYKLALKSKMFLEHKMVKSLGILQKKL